MIQINIRNNYLQYIASIKKGCTFVSAKAIKPSVKRNKMQANTDTVIARLTKKHPVNYSISADESNHCVLGHTIYGYVELEDEKIMYATDKAYRLRVVKRERLTPTYKSIRLQPKDSAVIIRGGKYDGQYIIRHEGDGWLRTTSSVADVEPMRAAYAEEFRNCVSFKAQYCYRGTFEVIKIA